MSCSSPPFPYLHYSTSSIMAHHERPRLYHKTLRDLPGSDTFPSFLSADLSTEPRFAFAGKATVLQGRTGSRPLESGGKTRVLHKVRPVKTLTTSSPSHSLTLPSSVALSQGSRSSTPRSFLTIEAINLELQLTEALALADLRPSPQRHRETLAAYVKALGSVAGKDPVFGSLILQVKSAIDVYISYSNYVRGVDLRDRNHILKRFLQEQKTILADQSVAAGSLDRQYEALKKEKSLLVRKVRQLEERYEVIGGNREVQRLEEMLRGARLRERRLLRLLEVVREAGSGEKTSKAVSSQSATSERSTEDLKSPLSLDFSESHSFAQ